MDSMDHDSSVEANKKLGLHCARLNARLRLVCLLNFKEIEGSYKIWALRR